MARINCTIGTIEQMIAQFNKRISELSGDEAVQSAVSYDDVSISDKSVEEVLDYFQNTLGWDTSNPRVQNYANAVAEYIDISRNAYDSEGLESTYSLDEWYRDTKLNYPEEIAEFEQDSDIESCDNAVVSAMRILPDGTEYDPEEYAYGYTEWDEIDSKSVQDADGFWTDYTMWYNQFEDRYVFTFGDKDIYYPENSDWDWECENEDEAWEWFNNYEGFEDEIEECSKITASFSGIETQWTATDVVRNMYNSFPEVEFVDERDSGDMVRLYFKYTSNLTGDKENRMLSYLDDTGLEYRVRDGKLLVIAPEDFEDAIQECVNSSETIYDSEDDYEQFSEKTATEVVQWMYNKYPQYPFIGETDIGNGRVELQFEMRDRNKEEISYMMDEVGLDCRFSGGVLKIVAPEDDNSTIESSYDSDQLKPFVVRFGWDSGDPENGPSYGYGEDIVYALSEEEACSKWEAENADQIRGFNSGKYGGYEGCFARPATESDIQEFESSNQEWDELLDNYRFEEDGVYPIDECSSIQASYASWSDAYKEFESIINRYFPDEKKINREVDKFYELHKDDPMVEEAYKRWVPDTDDSLSDEDMDKVWEIAERYNSSRPVSGDWSTEAQHELEAIANELNISESLAKKIMIDKLGFEESMF